MKAEYNDLNKVDYDNGITTNTEIDLKIFREGRSNSIHGDMMRGYLGID